jgi:hypothetical protein
MNSASLCGLAGRYDNLIPDRFLAPIDFLKIPALIGVGNPYLPVMLAICLQYRTPSKKLDVLN